MSSLGSWSMFSVSMISVTCFFLPSWFLDGPAQICTRFRSQELPPLPRSFRIQWD
jgi:hypothetical protein